MGNEFGCMEQKGISKYCNQYSITIQEDFGANDKPNEIKKEVLQSFYLCGTSFFIQYKTNIYKRVTVITAVFNEVTYIKKAAKYNMGWKLTC